MVGGQVGYRWQSANWVFGVEAQGDWASLNGSNLSSPAALTSAITNQTKVDAIGLFTGQVGYAWNNVLWYLKGGAAVTDDKYNGMLTGIRAHRQLRERDPLGRRGRHRPRIRLCAELVGRRRIRPPVHGQPQRQLCRLPPAVSRIDSIRQDVDMATVRVNYRFGGPVVAKY